MRRDIPQEHNNYSGLYNKALGLHFRQSAPFGVRNSDAICIESRGKRGHSPRHQSHELSGVDYINATSVDSGAATAAC